jgi:hypothetical protein
MKEMQRMLVGSERHWIKNSLALKSRLVPSTLAMLNKAIDLEIFEFNLNHGGKEIIIKISDQIKENGKQASTGPSDDMRSYSDRRNNITLKKVNNSIISDLERELTEIYGNENGSIVKFYECSHYEDGQLFKPHYDFRKESGYIRKRTIILYMLQPNSGGELRFPLLQVEIKPTQGLLVSWHNTSDNLKPDILSLHESLTINSGSKSLMTFFQYTWAI